MVSEGGGVVGWWGGGVVGRGGVGWVGRGQGQCVHGGSNDIDGGGGSGRATAGIAAAHQRWWLMAIMVCGFDP